MGRDLVLTQTIGSQNFVLEETYFKNYVNSGSVPTYGTSTFTLSDMPTFSTLAGLFDLYRIEAVEVLFRPVGITTVTDAGVGTLESIPNLLTLIDYNDTIVPTALAQFQRASTYRQCTATSAMKLAFKPRWQLPVYQSAIATAYSVGPANTWLGTTYPGIPHYGLKYCLTEDAGTGNPGNGKFTYSIWVKQRVTFSRRR